MSLRLGHRGGLSVAVTFAVRREDVWGWGAGGETGAALWAEGQHVLSPGGSKGPAMVRAKAAGVTHAGAPGAGGGAAVRLSPQPGRHALPRPAAGCTAGGAHTVGGTRSVGRPGVV